VENGLLTHQSIVWVKPRPVLTRSHFMWKYEPCWYGWKQGNPPARKPPTNQPNVWEISQKGQQDGIHPTQKPTEIFEWPISWHTTPGDFVYEPFCGSGSQLIAAAKLGRRCLAMELAPEFVDVIRRRWTGFARSAGVEPGEGGLA
jgi:DNA modification methylase